MSIKSVLLVSITVLTVASVTLLNFVSGKLVTDLLGTKALEFLRAVAANLDKEALNRVVESMDSNTEDYRALNAYLIRAREVSSFKYLYTVKIEGSKLTYLVDGLPPTAEGFSALGESEDLPLKGYEGGKEFYTGLYKDENWGVLQTASVPIIYKGKLIAWIAGDFDAGYVKQIRLRINVIFLGIVLTFSVVILIVFALALKKMGLLYAVFERLGNGDLSFEISVKGKDEVSKILSAGENMRQNMRSLISTLSEKIMQIVKVSSEGVDSSKSILKAVSNLEKSNEELQRFTEDLHSSLEEMTATAQQINASVNTLVDEIGSISRATESVTNATNAGKEALSSSVDFAQVVLRSIEDFTERVKQLRYKSSNIGEVLNEITSIAEQTNLLALNAAIEAARAGELGRGFAVVADEIRKLAEQSKQAAHRITLILGDITAASDNVSRETVENRNTVNELVERIIHAQQKYGEIESVVKNITEEITNLHTLSEEQKAAINQFVNSMTTITSGADNLVKLVSEIENVIQNIRSLSKKQSEFSEELDMIAKDLSLRQSIFKV